MKKIKNNEIEIISSNKKITNKRKKTKSERERN
jgi:hypothetical protein